MSIESFSEELVNGIVGVLREKASSIILYGSVARGTETPGSDIDIAVIVKGSLNEETEDSLSDLIVELDLKFDRVFSVIDIDEAVFWSRDRITPFYRNIQEEGIVLWKAA